MNLAAFARLGLTTITAPETAWRQLKALALPRQALWMLLTATVVIDILLTWAMHVSLDAVAPPAADSPAMAGQEIVEALYLMLENSPISFAALQFMMMIVTVGAVTYIGRLFGGRASFDDVLLAVSWMKVILIAVQITQLVLIHISFFAVSLVALAEMVLYLYLGVRLTQTVHGFRNPALVALGMLLSFMIIAFAIGLRLALFGVTPPEI